MEVEIVRDPVKLAGQIDESGFGNRGLYRPVRVVLMESVPILIKTGFGKSAGTVMNFLESGIQIIFDLFLLPIFLTTISVN